MKKKFTFFVFNLKLFVLTICLVFLFQNVYSQDYIPITNYHNGISISVQGTAGTDYVFDRYYFDPLINDCGLCYIKSNVDISLEHNQYNSRIYGDDTQIIGGDFGDIRYKVDKDWQSRRWAGDDGPYGDGRKVYPSYPGPFSFDDMEYEAGVPVVGTFGFNPGYDMTDRSNSYSRGLKDLAGNEYHYFTYADDDDAEPNWKNLEMSSSDGKSMLFCVNPITPAIWLSPAVSGAQYYTTPAKVYWVPKIHEQTSYVMADVNINLKNIMNSNTVYYRIDGGAYQAYTGPISSNILSDGEHILEFYYNSSYVQTRKIVKNPDHPSKADVFEDGSGHGYILWRNEAEFLRWKERLLTGVWSNNDYYARGYFKYKSDYLTDFDASGNGGIRNSVSSTNALMYALVGAVEGVENNIQYMEVAKSKIMNTARMHIENIGWEVHHDNDPNPAHELTYRGYYDDLQLWSNALTYDILAKYYRSDQFSGGITPIEDYRLRDMLAVIPFETELWMGGYRTFQDPAVDPSPQTTMWATAHQNAGAAAAMAMPSYNTNYYGTSGFNGSQATHAWTPYPDYPRSWKDMYLNVIDKDDPAQVAKLHPFPNQNQMFNWYDGTSSLGTIRENGDWGQRVGYGLVNTMGHGIEIFYNIMKRKFDKSYPKLDLFIEKSVNGTLYSTKDHQYFQCGRRMMANEYFPELAPLTIDVDDSDLKYFYKSKFYYLIFHNPDWDDTPTCQSSEPPTVPANLAGMVDVTTVQLSWSASTHAECSVSGYRIKRNGAVITTTFGTQYSDANLNVGTQYQYEVAAVSEAGIVSDYCAPIQIATMADSDPPVIVNVPNADILTIVQIEFSEEIDPVTAENTSNYSINNGVSVSSAELQLGNKIVKLSVSAMNVGSTYIITVNNIDDLNGNTISANSTAVFGCVEPSANLALNKPVIADSELTADYIAEKAVDGITNDNTSRWISADLSYPHWIEIDLMQNTNVDKVDFYTGHTSSDYIIYDYQIQYWDGSNWVDAVSVTGNTLADVSHSFAPVNTSKLRLYCTAGQDNIVRLFEIEAYNNSGSSTIGVNEVSVSPTTLAINEGETSHLTETVSPSNATNKSVNWSSDNTSVATVDANGVVSALSSGQAIITVTTVDGSYSAHCDVTVNTVAGDVNLAFGKTVTVSSEPQPDNGAAKIVDEITSDDSRWSAENFPQWAIIDLDTICNISKFEVYPYMDRDYQYIIEISDDGVSYSPVVDRSSNTEAGDVLVDNVSVSGRYVKITLSDAYSYTGDWASITELKAFGTIAQSIINVTGVSISPATITLDEGQVSELTENVLPTDADDISVTWSSSNPLIATVDANGIVNAISAGSCTVTVTTNDGGFTANCDVTVNAPVVISNLALGKAVAVSSEPQPDNGAVKIVDDITTDDSRWSAEMFPQWAEIDLGTNCNIISFEVYPYSDRDYQYIIEMSDDGANYITVVDRSSNTEAGDVLMDNIETSGRFVKITILGAYSYSGDWASITEMKVFGYENNSTINVAGISVSPAILDIPEGQSSDLTETISPADASNKNVSWSSDNTSIATVDTNGLVTAISAGTCAITVTSDDGGYTAVCNVTVNPVVLVNEYYCDPINGSMSNDGSESSPWGSLEEVFNAGKTFEEGDLINLLTGYHGSVIVSGNNPGYVNIKAVSGAQAELKSIEFEDASYWNVSDVMISPEFASTGYEKVEFLVDIGSCSHITIDNCEMYSVDNPSSWGTSEWDFESCSGVFINGDNNRIENCTVRNVSHGIFVDRNGDYNFIDNNLIANFSKDGMRGIGNYNTFQYNRVQDNYVVSTHHDDGFQSYSIGANGAAGTGTVYGNVLRGNTIINTTDPNRPYIGPLQGIGNFDGMYEDWVIENNVIICDHYHGITMLGAKNCKIVNNTVVDANTSSPGPAWIQIAAHKDGTLSTGNIVKNNLCSDLNNDANIGTVSHNIEISYFDYNAHFVDFANYNLNLIASSPAIDAGSSIDAPNIDIAGVSRPQGAAYDIGAYEFIAGDTIPVTGVSLSPVYAALNVGGTISLAENVAPVSATDKSVTWSSNNPSIAIIDANGLVTAISEGNCIVTVTTNDGGYTANSEIVVNNSVSVNLALGKPVSVDSELNADYVGAKAVDGITDDNASRWISASTSYPHWIEIDLQQVSEVNRVDFYTGHTNADYLIYDYQIQYWDGSDWVNVISATENTLSDVSHSFAPVSTEKLRLYCTAGQDNMVRLFEIEAYGSSTPEVPVTSVAVSSPTLTLYEGQSSDLNETVIPSNATDPSVVWTSGNNAVATVDDNGLVTAISAGTTTINVTTNDGGFTATCNVTVNTIVLENLALGRPAIADSEISSSYPASKAVDGDKSSNASRWVSENTSYPHWIEIDLQQTCEVSGVNFWTGYYDYRYPVYDYQIQYWDGTNWIDIVNVTGNSDAVVSHTFSVVSTNKIRLFCTAGEDNMVRLFEIEVWGYNTLKSLTAGKNNINKNLSYGIKIFPNPIINGSFQVESVKEFDLDKNVQLRIFDISSKLVYFKQLYPSGNPAQKSIEVNDVHLNKGLYILNISGNKISVNKKIIIK